MNGDDADCSKYINLVKHNTNSRRSISLKSAATPYKSPYNIGLVFGDPHIITLGKEQFTFNSLGEFVLFKDVALGFELQARFSLPFLSTKASRVAAVAVKSISSTVSLYLDTFDEFLFIVDGEFLHQPPALGRRYLVAGDHILIERKSEKHVRLSCSNRIILDFSSEQGMITVTLFMPTNYENSPIQDGILAFRSEDTVHDHEEIHQRIEKFKLQREEDSLFLYSKSSPFSAVNNADFSPILPPPPFNPDISFGAQDACGGAQGFFYDTCYFDVVMEENFQLAQISISLGRSFQAFQRSINQAPVMTLVDVLNPIPASLGENSIKIACTDPESHPIRVTILSPEQPNAFFDDETSMFGSLSRLKLAYNYLTIFHPFNSLKVNVSNAEFLLKERNPIVLEAADSYGAKSILVIEFAISHSGLLFPLSFFLFPPLSNNSLFHLSVDVKNLNR